VKEKPVRDDAAIEKAVAARDKHWRKHLEGNLRALNLVIVPAYRSAHDAEQRVFALTSAIERMLEEANVPQPAPIAAPPPDTVVIRQKALAVPIKNFSPEVQRILRAKPRATVITDQDNGISPSDRKILNALALMSALGVPSTREALGFFAGYSSSAGRFNNLVGALRTKGLVDYPGDGQVMLTEEGWRHANPEGAEIQSRDDLHQMWASKLDNSQWKILDVLLRAHPKAVTREQLAEATNYSAEAGRFNNLVGSLRTLGAATYPTKGSVRASDVLFPEGLP
jgi:hypothetical protein